MYYNENIPLETALEMFDDPHIRYEIIEDYFAAQVGKAALAVDAAEGASHE
jgi:hypothetical protein